MLKDEPLRKVVEVQLPAPLVAQKTEEAAKDMAKNAAFQGFRKGKVPVSLIKSRHGEALRNRIIEQVAGEQITSLTKKFNQALLTQPSLEMVKTRSKENAKDLVFKISFSLMPKVPEIDFSTLTITKPPLEVTPQNIAKTLEQLVARNPVYQPEKNRVATKGDKIKVVSTVAIKGIHTDNTESFEGVLGEGNFFAEIEKELIGKKSGWKGKISLTLPDNPQNKRLSNKPAIFHINIEQVAKPTKAKADDQFAKNLKYADLAALKRDIKDRLQEQANQIIQSDLRSSLAREISKKYPFELPAELLQTNTPPQKTKETPEAKKARIEKTADELRLQFIMQKLAPKHKVTDEELKNSLDANEAHLKSQGQTMSKEQKQQISSRLTNILTERKVLTHIYDKATIKTATPKPAK